MPRRGENIRKRKDGRWEGRYIFRRLSDGKAKYRSVYGKSYSEAKSKLQKEHQAVVKNAPCGSEKNILFREALFLWIQSRQMSYSEQTHGKYLSLIENHIVPWFGDLKIKRVSAELINAFLTEKSRNGRLDGSGGLSANYLQTVYFIINAAYSYAVRQGYALPLQGEIMRPAGRKKECEVLTFREQFALERYVTSDIDARKLGVLISLYMGLRLGEICGLMWEDFDFRLGTLSVQRSVKRIRRMDGTGEKEKTKLMLGDAKTETSNRIIPIPAALLPFLKAENKQEGFVIRGEKYEYSDPRTYQYCFHRYLKDCRLRSFHFHSLRHTFATRCVEAGMDVKTLSEILGHANVNITLKIYVHSSLEQKRKQIDKLGAVCGQ